MIERFGSRRDKEAYVKALEDTIVALGAPVSVRTFGTPSAPVAAIARWRHGKGQVDIAPSNAIRLAVSLVDAPNARGRGDRAATTRTFGGSVSIFSPVEGVAVEVSGEADVVQLFLDQAYVQAVLERPFVCPPMFDLRDDWTRATIMRLFVDGAPHGPDDALMMEQGLHALSARLERHANQWRSSENWPARLFRGGLAPAAFRRVEAIMDTALDEGRALSLGEMADSIGISVTHFVRAFARHTGSTPHKYLVRRRLDRAISLLRVAAIPVAEVADTIGFATPAHFVATFRAAIGVTPGSLREALAG